MDQYKGLLANSTNLFIGKRTDLSLKIYILERFALVLKININKLN